MCGALLESDDLVVVRYASKPSVFHNLTDLPQTAIRTIHVPSPDRTIREGNHEPPGRTLSLAPEIPPNLRGLMSRADRRFAGERDRRHGHVTVFDPPRRRRAGDELVVLELERVVVQVDE